MELTRGREEEDEEGLVLVLEGDCEWVGIVVVEEIWVLF